MNDALEPSNITFQPGTIHVNLSPHGFYRWAMHFYVCRQQFRCPDSGFSPVPYFLLCRAIELVLKAQHLKRQKQSEVKAQFRHDLLGAYNALDISDRVLSQEDKLVLEQANEVYKSKRFEYMSPGDALTGFSKFPDLELLDQVASKLLEAASDLDLARR